MKLQKDIFLESEGDNWFKRNESDFIDLDEILPFLKSNDKLLEIGCSNGTNLKYLNNKLPDIELHGIDPSTESVNSGMKDFKNFSLQVGTSDHLDFPDESFDVVLLGFCLYLVDRKLIFKTISIKGFGNLKIFSCIDIN